MVSLDYYSSLVRCLLGAALESRTAEKKGGPAGGGREAPAAASPTPTTQGRGQTVSGSQDMGAEGGVNGSDP